MKRTIFNPWVILIGDLLLLLLFAFLGRQEHGETLKFGQIVQTSFPFMLSWVVTGFATKAFSVSSVSRPGRAVQKLLLTWIIAGPVGLLLRSWILGRWVLLPFVAVALIVNFVLLLIWRLGISIYMKLTNSGNTP